jgi:hypothetical protein
MLAKMILSYNGKPKGSTDKQDVQLTRFRVRSNNVILRDVPRSSSSASRKTTSVITLSDYNIIKPFSVLMSKYKEEEETGRLL